MEQRLLQSPQMIQAMQILQLSSQDVQDRIDQELLENPVLESQDGREEGSAGDDAPAPGEAGPLAALDAVLAMHERDRWDPALRRRRGTVEEADRKHEAMQNTPAPYHSLGASLLGEVALLELDDRRRELVEYLVFSLDARGYLSQPLALIAAECDIEGATEAELSGLLDELRQATHPALGASDLRECLLLQVDRMAQDHPLLRRLVAENLADIAANRLPHIAAETGHSLEDIGQAVELLRTLDPYPGSAYGDSPTEIIRPEVVVEDCDGTFQVRLTREGTRELGISADYSKLLREAARGDSMRKWLAQRLGSARWFIAALAQRRDTLLRVARAIFERQARFLEGGPRGLLPLRMGEVADATGVHISTVSRAVAGKYAQTPHGILPLRSFFSGGTATASGGVASQKSIQERLKDLVAGEDPGDPLSDDRLAEHLHGEGIPIARRTVTKYRRVLAIRASSLRRVH
jgi:RNA polymerase sigma-54 factor